MKHETFADWLKAQTAMRGAQIELSRKCGVTPGMISEMERGLKRPSPEMCNRLANGNADLAKKLHKLGARASGWRV